MSLWRARLAAIREGRPITDAPGDTMPPADAIGAFGANDTGKDRRNPPLRRVTPAPAPEPWPDGVDYHLTRDAARLSGLIAAGGDWRWCPAGGLDVTLPDGRLLLVSPATVARLRAARLLPAEVAGGATD